VMNIPEFRTFTKDYLFFDKIPNGTEKFYKNVNPFENEGNSQMSLLLPEMYFLIKCVPIEMGGTVLYLGAHPGDHINFLASFFPKLNFKVYDYILMPEDKIMEKIGMDPYLDSEGEHAPLKNIEKIKSLFTVEEAIKIKTLKDGGSETYKNIFVISDIRNKDYSITNSNERNSQIIDNDTYFQMLICQIMQPNCSMVKYRPKLKNERISVPEKLTTEENSAEAKKLYYLYPKGTFLKSPFQKKTQKSIYFITNNYELTEKYYHDDIIKMIDYHHGYERKAIFYDNPFEDEFGMETACLGIDEVKKIIKKAGFDENNIPPEEFCFGCGWDSRASVFIIISYLCYLKGNTQLLNKFFGISTSLREHISSFLIFPYIFMTKDRSASEETEKKEDQ